MAEEIIKVYWSATAQKSFDNIIAYLGAEWTEKEIQKFVQRTESVLALIQRYPEMSQPSNKRKNVRLFILNRHTKLVYNYLPKKKQITLLLFWNMKQNPANFKY